MKVGDKVLCQGKMATIMFIGATQFGQGNWYGVSFSDKSLGKNDGSVNGVRYFTCDNGSGSFVREDQLKPYSVEEEAAVMIQSATRGHFTRHRARHEVAFHTWNSLDQHDEGDLFEQYRDISRAMDHEIRQKILQSNESRLLSSNASPPTLVSPDAIPEDYKGPRFDVFPPRREDCENYLDWLIEHPQDILLDCYAWNILDEAIKLYERTVTSPVVRLELPKENVVTVNASTGASSGFGGGGSKETRLMLCGDTHGQLNDVLWLFYKFGAPSANNIYLFNGDIADRGAHAVEIFLLLLVFKLNCPSSVIINRGNHENADMNEVYGFANEVRDKYGSAFYQKFQELFYLLPLAVIIEKRILCVHGGLFRKDNVTIKQLESLDRRRGCPESPITYEDTLFFDILWSDPMKENGRKKSARGVDCMMFGPDITDHFLMKNNLEVCIRSHQVPSTGRGFEVHHDGKCVTVFSASNYCGTSGNYGGVIVFQPDLSFEIQEYWAPSLSEIKELIAETKLITNKVEVNLTNNSLSQNSSLSASRETSHYLTLYQAERKSSSKALLNAAEKMEKDSLKRLAKLIVEKKQDLWWYFWNADEKKTGLITPTIFRNACNNVIGDLPWLLLQKQLKVVDSETNTIDYCKFLSRFRTIYSPPNHKKKHIKWKQEILHQIFEAILVADLTLRETLLLLDRNSDGTVSYSEFQQFLKGINLGLSEPQMRALMRVITTTQMIQPDDSSAVDGSGNGTGNGNAGEKSGRIHVAHFLARFKVVYEKTLLREEFVEGWTKSLLGEIGKLILTEAKEKNNKERIDLRRRSSFKSIFLLQKFQLADVDNVGFLTYQNFVECMKTLPLKLINTLEREVDEDALMGLAKAIDVTGNGKINYCEFINAFYVVDTSSVKSHGDTSEEVFSEICSTLYKHSTSIKRACRLYDYRNVGLITPEELQEILLSLNTVLSKYEAPLTSGQIDEIVELTDVDSEGYVHYEEFLDSFKVIDIDDYEEEKNTL